MHKEEEEGFFSITQSDLNQNKKKQEKEEADWLPSWTAAMTLLCCELSTRCAISSLFLKVAIFTPALDLVFFVFFIFLFFEEDDFGM